MNSSDITSEAHINAAKEAIAALVSEYETLDGRVTLPARGRRTTAMERLSAVTFGTVTDELDPCGMDDLNELVAEGTLKWSLSVTDLMVTAMLDFRENSGEHHHHRPWRYPDRLRDTLLELWIIALEELKQDPGEGQGDAGEVGEGGECGHLAA